VPLDVLKTRLIQRWRDHDFDPDQARARALSNDIPNAKTVVTGSRTAQITVTNN
jgi:pantothenate kinase